MAKVWNDFYPYIQPYIPGCPEIVMEAHLQEAAAEFCAKSEVWRFDVEQDFTSKGESDYEVDVPTGAILENILTFYLDGSALRSVSDRHYDLPSTQPRSRPMYYSIYQDASVRLYPTPDQQYKFEGVAVLKPSLSATGVEDYIFETHGRCISYGAIAKLAIIPGKEWSNPELSSYYQNKFYKEADIAKSRDSRRVNLRIAPVGFDCPSSRRGY